MLYKCWIIKEKISPTLNKISWDFFSLLSNWKLFKAWTRGIIFILGYCWLVQFFLSPRFSYPRSINLSYLLFLGKRMEIFMTVLRSYGEAFIACSEIFEYSSFPLIDQGLTKQTRPSEALIFLSLCFCLSSTQ